MVWLYGGDADLIKKKKKDVQILTAGKTVSWSANSFWEGLCWQQKQGKYTISIDFKLRVIHIHIYLRARDSSCTLIV